MDPRVRRLVITTFIVLLVGGIVFLPPLLRPVPTTPDSGSQTPATEETTGSAGTANGQDSTSGAVAPGQSNDDAAGAGEEPPGSGQGEEDAVASGSDTPTFTGGEALLSGLRAVAPGEVIQTPTSIGSLDWREARYEVRFSVIGAGIDRITF